MANEINEIEEINNPTPVLTKVLHSPSAGHVISRGQLIFGHWLLLNLPYACSVNGELMVAPVSWP